MTTKLYIDNHDELDNILRDNTIEISKSIVDSILKHLRTPKKIIHIFEIFIDYDKSVYDVTIFRSEAYTMLEMYLPILEKYEEYERCNLIKMELDKIKK